MKSKLFLPDIKRNRWVTNWVVVYLDDGAVAEFYPPSRPSWRNPKIVGITILALCVTTATFLTTPRHEAGPSASNPATDTKLAQVETATPGILPTHFSAAKVSDRDVCAQDSLDELLSPLVLQSPVAPNVPGFSLGSVEYLGGAFFASYTCESGSDLFNAQWVRVGEKWTLKNISRSP
jgi:hypothetical protein